VHDMYMHMCMYVCMYLVDIPVLEYM
jgi:hypothetical protein